MSEKKKKREAGAWPVTLGTLMLAAAVGLLSWLQLDTYEQGIMEVYADQQDGYVQLVIDQINLIEDESSEAVVNNILETLDASSNKYWTLSREDALIFIKDVQETNRYKGFTTATYFVSDSAKEFIGRLWLNRVVHGTIELNGVSYIASGAKFQFGGGEYGICLFTASAIILDNNTYLSAKINLFILFIIILAVFIVGGLALSIIAQNRYKKLTAVEDDNRQLCERIERLTVLVTRQEYFNAQYMAFGESCVDMLIDKLEERDVWPLTYIVVKCSSEEQRRRFLIDTQALCDSKFIRALAKNNYLLMFNIHSSKEATAIVRSTAANSGAEIVGSLVFQAKPDIPLRDAIEQYNSSVMTE